MKSKTFCATGAVLALAALIVVGCGSGTNDSGSSSGKDGNFTDRAFLNDMTPHHASAIDMARLAQTRAQHPEIKQLAASIVRDQRSEVRLMSTLKRRIPEGDRGSTLGMSHEEMGMSMEMGDLKKAVPFDRAFIDAMAAHHQGAIMMAQMELKDGENRQVTALARRIIAAQQGEIEDMNRWRQEWYGAPLPKQPSSGDESMHEMSGM